MKITIPTLMGLSFLILISYFTYAQQINTHYTYETQCLGTNLDGSLTLIAWGTGINRKEAISQSLKNGLNDLIFVGIRNRNAECNLKPLINDVNGREMYNEYFRTFFSNKGPHLQFIKTKYHSKKRMNNGRIKGRPQVLYKITFLVYYDDLRNKLQQDNIIR